jgi:hypothetical protein
MHSIVYLNVRSNFSSFFVSVQDMIKEVDVDGDGRIDFYGKGTTHRNILPLYTFFACISTSHKVM